MNFLDIEIKINEENEIITSVYRKPTDSGKYLDYKSNHPKQVKIGIINTLLHRGSTHCSNKENLEKEIKVISSSLVKNNYPKQLINNVKRKRERKEKKEDGVKKTKEKLKHKITLPYIPRLGEKIKRIGLKFGISTIFKSSNTIKSKLVKFKPKNPVINKNVIYSIPCECDKIYVGETGRELNVRVKEHRTAVEKKKDINISKLVEHSLETGHRILWEDVRAIGKEEEWRKRKIHEAGVILNGGNRIISTPSIDIDKIWHPVIKEMKNLLKEESPKVRRSKRLRKGGGGGVYYADMLENR